MLFRSHAGLGADPLNIAYGILAGNERLRVASVDLVPGEAAIVGQLTGLISTI